jgi:hypothetical protein
MEKANSNSKHFYSITPRIFRLACNHVQLLEDFYTFVNVSSVNVLGYITGSSCLKMQLREAAKYETISPLPIISFFTTAPG